jgi:two-component system phosphate regulon sensor histidine kinase PhoR
VGEEMLYVAIPLKENARVIGVLRVSLFLREIDSVLAGLRNRIITVATATLGISLLAAFVFSRALSRPVRNLISASRRFGEGDLDARVILKSGGELKELADSFNLMGDRIKALVSELSFRREELAGVISSVRDGLLVLDKEGKVLLSNDGFRDVVGERDIEGRFYWEVIRVASFGDIIKAVGEGDDHVFREIQVGQKIYSCGASFVKPGEEMVVWLHDVTQIKDVERVKKDFIVNLSHELRTPLTAIKGFLEAAVDEANPETRHYLDIVSKHTGRLTHIVGDLLKLSELEDRGTELELETVDLGLAIREAAKIFEHAVREKGLLLNISIAADVPYVRADTYKLQQVLINLIDNAVKYTEEGSVSISVGRAASKAVIEVSDTGIGIPEEHRDRIFERFYVVDKSRSRALGGTGLGLSIVKHIVLLHGWEISITGSPGTGTTVVVAMPTDITGPGNLNR